MGGGERGGSVRIEVLEEDLEFQQVEKSVENLAHTHTHTKEATMSWLMQVEACGRASRRVHTQPATVACRNGSSAVGIQLARCTQVFARLGAGRCLSTIISASEEHTLGIVY